MKKRDLIALCTAWTYVVIMAALVVLLAVRIWT